MGPNLGECGSGGAGEEDKSESESGISESELESESESGGNMGGYEGLYGLLERGGNGCEHYINRLALNMDIFSTTWMTTPNIPPSTPGDGDREGVRRGTAIQEDSIENVKYVENIRNIENIKYIENIKNIENVKYIENIKNMENVKYMENIKYMNDQFIQTEAKIPLMDNYFMMSYPQILPSPYASTPYTYPQQPPPLNSPPIYTPPQIPQPPTNILNVKSALKSMTTSFIQKKKSTRQKVYIYIYI